VSNWDRLPIEVLPPSGANLGSTKTAVLSPSCSHAGYGRSKEWRKRGSTAAAAVMEISHGTSLLADSTASMAEELCRELDL
jgi:hypothetical protein